MTQKPESLSTDFIDSRLRALGIALPETSAPAANYVPWCISGSVLHISGQLPMQNGKLSFTGAVIPDDQESLSRAVEAARICGLNIIAHMRSAVQGDWSRICRVIRLGGFVNAPAGFQNHPKIINGASDLMVDVFGDAGRHARFAIGVSSLPFDATVEIDASIEISGERP